MTGNCSVTLTFAKVGGVTLRCIQDATGSRTISFATTIKTEDGITPILTTTASAYDILFFYYDGTNINCFPFYNMA
jgi:hypothetical protein